MINIIEIERLFILFLFYSFSGWAIETTRELIKSKKFVNRGFLIGPICPVYGIGAILITLLLTRYKEDYFVVFGLSALMCGSLEYFTSYIMEKLFKARWWDYSNSKYNINGRICLETIALFGIAGIGITSLLNPLIDTYIISIIPENTKNIICISIGVILIIDIIVSLKVMNKIKNITASVKTQFKDNTEEISTKVREAILEKSLPYRRIVKAFPQAFATKVKEGTKKITDTAAKVKEKTIENIGAVKEKTINTVSGIKTKTIENIKIVKAKTKRTKDGKKAIMRKKVIQRNQKRR